MRGVRHAVRWIGLAVAAAVLAGCAIEPTPAAHYFMVHKEGDPYSREHEKRDPSQFQGPAWAILGGIQRHVERQAAKPGQPPARVLLFIHGGLNPYTAGAARVRQLLDTDAADSASCADPQLRVHLDEAAAVDEKHRRDDLEGVLHCTSYYPVFINWNSSLLSSLWDDLFILRDGERRPFVAAATAPFVLAGRLTDSVLAVPYSLWLFVRQEPSPPSSAGEPPPDKGWTYYALAPVRALTVPFIEGFGAGAWDVMKRRADFVTARFLPAEAVEDVAPRARLLERTHREGAGFTFMRLLINKLCLRDGRPYWVRARIQPRGALGACQAGDDPYPVELTVAGHSMGALVLNRILRLFPDVPFQHVVYLASASSITDFEDSVLPYLDRHPATLFRAYSLPIRRERLEKGVLDVYERGSLLVWIDYLFERVNTPSQLRAGRYWNLWRPSEDYVALLEREYEDRSTTPPRRRIEFVRLTASFSPEKHGDFANRAKLPCLLGDGDPAALHMVGCEAVTGPGDTKH